MENMHAGDEFRKILSKLQPSGIDEKTNTKCKTCNGLKWLMNNGKPIQCWECISKEDIRTKYLRSANIPEFFTNITFSTYRKDADQKALEMAKKYCLQGKNESILIYGEYGIGKTSLAKCILEYRIKNELKQGLYIKAIHLLSEIKNSFNDDNDLVDCLGKYLRVPILLLDDLGMEPKITEWTKSVFLELIAYRHDNCLPTIYTTNIEGEELAEHITVRAAWLLSEATKNWQCRMKGKNLRK